MIAKIISVDGTTLEVPCDSKAQQDFITCMFESSCYFADEYSCISDITAYYMELIDSDGKVVSKDDYWLYFRNK